LIFLDENSDEKIN